jgi:hypothetical protein
MVCAKMIPEHEGMLVYLIQGVINEIVLEMTLPWRDLTF